MAAAGAAVARTLDLLLGRARPGTTTRLLDALARDALAEAGAAPLFPGYPLPDASPFPAALCACVNSQAVHAPPGDRPLVAGDLLCLDLGASLGGWCADASRAVVVGGGEDGGASGPRARARQAIVDASRATTAAAVAAVAPGVRWSDVADIARRCAESLGFRLVPGFAGHGIGRSLHEPPRAPMYPGPADDFTLRAGMTLTIEPILVTGGVELCRGDDGWTYTTADDSDACQHEETVAVVRSGSIVLTDPGC